MRRRSPFWLIALLLLALLSLVPLVRAQSGRRPTKPAGKPPASATPAPAQQQSSPSPLPADLEVKRLILKDGSYQGIVKYEMQGDRVRYLSSERFEWEDVPTALIDWAATEKFAREGGRPEPSQASREIDAEEEAERKKEEEQTPLVAEGLRLPATGGVFLLDVYDKQAQLIELQQNGGEVNTNRKGNILRSTINPLAGQKQTIELKSQHARIQSHVSNPFFYVDVAPDDQDKSKPSETTEQSKADKIKDSYRIVRLVTDPKKNVRIVGNIKIAIYGKVTQEQKFIPTNIEAFSGPWLKVTPAEPLEPGEYALVEMLPENQMNLFVWDFGVDPKAPVNPGAWRPQPAKANAEPTQAPVIRERNPK